MKPVPPAPAPWPEAELRAYIDGGSRGNPGPAGYGVVIQDRAGNTLESFSRSIGKATNNVAEYRALLAALAYALDRGARSLEVLCDSELVVRQMQGRYRVQSPDLKPLYLEARQQAARLARFSIRHIPREQNRLADQLANQAMDGAGPEATAAEASLLAVCEGGRLRPLSAAPELEEGAEYEVKLRKRNPPRSS
ncbi:MAG TPA: ribonuclease HI family protein [Terriglobia bacterium]|nr:ribonuclease HI family protein [Terriglobia bacterium]